MSRRQTNPLRALSAEERTALTQVSRSQRMPAAQVARAVALLAVADGQSYTAAARKAGRRDNDTVAEWVARFNREGLPAVVPRHGGGPPIRYADVEQRRILAEVQRVPERTRDGTATWSLRLLQRALRWAEDGLPTISTYTIWQVLHQAGVGRRAGPGAIPAWSCANANGACSWSATLMRGRKKADRAGLHAGITAGAVGLVRRRSWTVPDGAASRFQLAAEGPAGDATARVCARHYGQDPDPVPSRYRAGATPPGDAQHECDLAPLAQDDAGGRHGKAVDHHGSDRSWPEPHSVAGLAERPDDALHLARIPTAAAGVAGVG